MLVSFHLMWAACWSYVYAYSSFYVSISYYFGGTHKSMDIILNELRIKRRDGIPHIVSTVL